MSGACCTLPPVEVDYTAKGSYSQVGDLKSYVSGPEESRSVILYIYDVFGYSSQILQGADLLASQGFRVVMPDFLLGNYATADTFSGSEEGNKKKEAFFSGFPGAFSTQSEAVSKVVSALKCEGVKIGSVGACWGYKVIVLSKGSNHFQAIAGIHPSFAAVEDAEKIKSPVALLPSGNEDMKVMNKVFADVESRNKNKNLIKPYPEMVHGWMAARADLKDDNCKKQYVDGYETLSKFFKEHL